MVRARAANPDWIAGMMRHGFRGGAEIAATLDHMAAFAHLAGVVPPICSISITRPRWAATIWWTSCRRKPAALQAMRDRCSRPARSRPLGTRRNSILATLGAPHERAPLSKGLVPRRPAPDESGDGLVVRVRAPLGG